MGKFDLPQLRNTSLYFDWEESLNGRLSQSSPTLEQTIDKVGFNPASFGKDVAQGLAGTVASVGTSFMNPLLRLGGQDQIKNMPTSQSKIGNIVFGGQPIRDVQTRIKQFREEHKTLSGPGGHLAAPMVLAGIAMDLSGFGGSRKKLLETLAKETDVKVISNILKKAKLSDALAPRIAVAETAPQVENIIKNASKFGFKERGFITSVKEELPNVPASGKYLPRSTNRLATKAKNLVESNIELAEKMALTGTDDDAVAVGAELLKKYNAEGQFGKAADLAHTMASKLTESGRTVQAASILGRLTPEGHLRFAAREINAYNEAVEKARGGLFGLRKKIPNLTKEQANYIYNESKRIIAMPDGEAKAIAYKNLQNKVSDLIPSPLYQKIIAVWKAGLLTGIKTSGLNTFSNLFHGISEVAKDIPAVAIDSVASLFTGKRTLGLSFKTLGGVEEGFKKGWRYLKTGYDERNVAEKLDFKRVNFGNSKIAKAIQKYEESVFRVLGAEDQPFYYGAKARSLQSQAIAQAKNQGLKGAEAKSFINNLVANPTDDMLKYAKQDAEVAVFQNRTILGETAKTIQKIPAVGEVIVPFGRTPSSVVTQMINYSPVGIVKTIAENVGKGRFDQRLFAQGLGRGLTGSGVLYIGMEMAKKDIITTGYPKDERTRKQWELEGKKENSFYDPVNKKWRNVNVLGPAGNVLVMGAYLQNSINETGSFTQGVTEGLTGALASVKEQSFLQGVNQFTSAINDPQGYSAALLGGLESSIVPTIVGDVALASDPTQRNTTIKKAGLTGPLMGRIPGLRQQLQPKIDVMGQELPRAGGIIETMIDPTRPLNIRSSIVINELKRLASVGQLATPTAFADEKQFTQTLTREQITRLQRDAGVMLESKLNNLFKSDKYNRLPDIKKKEIILDFTNKSRVIARANMVIELTQGLSGQELRSKISELKASGFLTKEVFDTFVKIR